jgi:hypothetical protein
MFTCLSPIQSVGCLAQARGGWLAAASTHNLSRGRPTNMTAGFDGTHPNARGIPLTLAMSANGVSERIRRD